MVAMVSSLLDLRLDMFGARPLTRCLRLQYVQDSFALTSEYELSTR